MASVSTMGPWMKGPCEHGKELTWISSLEKSWRRSPKCNLEEQVTVFQMSSHKDHFRWKGQRIRSRILKLWTHWRIIQRSTWWECSVHNGTWLERDTERWMKVRPCKTCEWSWALSCRQHKPVEFLYHESA